MNKDEIKKALECCSIPSINFCKDCPYNNNGEFSCCDGEMCKDALNLITEQEQEIDRLKDDYAKLQEQFAQYQIASDKEIIAQKKQAVKEFAEKIKREPENFLIGYGDGQYDEHKYISVEYIDELLKEYAE